MNPNADPRFGANTPRGAVIRALLAAVLLAILLSFALRSEDAAEVASPAPLAGLTPPAMVPGLVEPEPASFPSAEPVTAEPVVPPASEPAPLAAPASETATPAPASIAASNAPPVKPPEPAKPAKPASPVAAEPAAKASSVAANERFRLQLGDFQALGAANSLRDAATASGYPAEVLHRVVIGPFATRDAARKTAERVKGYAVAGADAAKWWVQLGVFGDFGNAERLRATHVAEGRKAVVQGRVELGPYAGRTVADQVLAALREALRKPFADAQIVEMR